MVQAAQARLSFRIAPAELQEFYIPAPVKLDSDTARTWVAYLDSLKRGNLAGTRYLWPRDRTQQRTPDVEALITLQQENLANAIDIRTLYKISSIIERRV